MQRERTTLDSFPEPIDLNQGSLSWDDLLNPVENRLPSYIVATSEANINEMDVCSDFAQRFSGWDRGESSSRTSNFLDQHELGIWLGCSHPFSVYPDARLRDWSSDPSNISSTSHVMPARSLFLDNQLKLECIPSFCADSSRIGSLYSESNGGQGSSLSTFGSSCKRKALDGTSGQLYEGGCSTSNQPTEKNLMHDRILGHHVSQENLNVSSVPMNLTLTKQPREVNPSVAPGFYQSSNVSRISDSSARNLIPISRHGHHISMPFDASLRPSGNISSSAGLDSRSTMASLMNSNNSVNQSLLMHIDEEAILLQSFPCARSLEPHGDGPLATYPVFNPRREASVRSSHRTTPEYTVTGATTLQDHVDWSFTPGIHSFSSRAGPILRARSSTVWLPNQVQTPQNLHRLSEAAPWNPYVGLESGLHRSHRPLFHPSSISTDEVASSSRAQRRSENRSVPPSFDIQGEDAYRALSAVEGRHRLIRQVLNAMRRGTRVQAEDYMLLDPFLNGFAEFHDRYRDMRLDVDNMSYEELLALGESIGNVNTGLNEEIIKKKMRCRKYEAANQVPHNGEPCCICQENYAPGDDIGVSDCGHEFHSDCIKHWLKLKNLCPICKLTALGA